MKSLNEIKQELLSVVSENISVFDERPYGKKGIIIMIDNNGKKKSIPFKDRKNADKYNRNSKEDILRMLDDAKDLPFGKALDEGKVSKGTKVKPFGKVKVGDIATDYNGDEFKVVATGTVKSLIKQKLDDSGMMTDMVKNKEIDGEEEAIAIELKNGETVLWTYDEGGAVVYESVVNEKKFTKVTKQMWDKMTDEEQEVVLMTAFEDPDTAEKYIGVKWEKLPDSAIQSMTVEESISTELNESNPSINKKVHQELTDYLKDSTDPNQYLYDVKEIFKAILIDANFKDIASKVDKIFKKAKNSNTKDLSLLYQNKGQELAKICKWDVINIIDGIAFHVSMMFGRVLGQQIEELKSEL